MIKTSLLGAALALCMAFSSCLATTSMDPLSRQQQETGSPASDGADAGAMGAEAAAAVAEPQLPPLPNLSIAAGKTPARIRVDQTFATDFTATVLDEDTDSPAAGIPVTLRYPAGRLNDTVSFATRELTTDGNGMVSFAPPDTSFTCDSQVTFSVESKGGTKEVSIPYQVRTDRHNKGGVISIVDYTRDGRPVRDNSRSASALLTAFIRNGFSNVGLIDFVNEIHAGDQQKIYQAAKGMIAGSSNFFVYGTVKYNGDMAQEGSGYLIPLVGELTCLDVKTGKELYHTVIEVVGRGSSEWAALQNARMDLFAAQAAESILYGM